MPFLILHPGRHSARCLLPSTHPEVVGSPPHPGAGTPGTCQGPAPAGAPKQGGRFPSPAALPVTTPPPVFADNMQQRVFKAFLSAGREHQTETSCAELEGPADNPASPKRQGQRHRPEVFSRKTVQAVPPL